MKRISVLSLVAVLFLSCIRTAFAQSGLPESFLDKVSSNMVAFDYKYDVVKGNVSMRGEGDGLVWKNSFRISVDGMRIWCNGSDKWTLDTVSREAVAEPFDSTDTDFSANPAILLYRASEFFDVVSSENVLFAGKPALRADLSSIGESPVESVTLFFSREDLSLLVGASVTASDGTVTEFEFSSFGYLSPGDGSCFSFDSAGLDSSWVITDLRQ